MTFASQFSGCHSTDVYCTNRPGVSEEIHTRMSQSIGPDLSCGESIIPPGVTLENGLSEDETVAIALWNNASFQETLTQLGIARGDLIQAGLLTNPQLIMLFPVASKQWEWTLLMPLEALLLRQKRIELAETECHRIGNDLVQNGLNLIRDVRIAYAEYELAVEQTKLANEFITVRQRIAEIAKKRLQAGDISELETRTAQIDVSRAQRDAARMQKNIEIAKNQLALLMGVNHLDFSLTADNQLIAMQLNAEYDIDALLSDALESRPDLQAAAFSVKSAQQRAALSRWAWLRFDAGADANSRGLKGYEAGPGIRLDVPIFNRNEGGIVRASAEVDQAIQRYTAVQNQVTRDVKTSRVQLLQASENLQILTTIILPSLNDATQIAEKAFAGGGATYLLVLQTNDQFLSAKTEELDVKLALRRAKAELERSVGRKVDYLTQENVPIVPAAPEAQESAPEIKKVVFTESSEKSTPLQAGQKKGKQLKTDSEVKKHSSSALHFPTRIRSSLKYTDKFKSFQRTTADTFPQSEIEEKDSR